MSDNIKYGSKLKHCYNKLSNSNLVRTKIVNTANIIEFQNILNDSLPDNESDTNARHLARDYYYCMQANYGVITAQMPHLILIAEARDIVEFFGLKRLIFITYENQLYSVSKIIKGYKKYEIIGD